MPHKTDIKSLNYNELVQYVESINEKKFRAAQLYSWMHEKLAESYDEMTNISDKLKNTLKEDTLYTSLKIVKMQESRIDGTRKYLFELYDGNLIESVFMKYHHGNSVCISSQVGCKMGCRFCASTLNGCVRNLFLIFIQNFIFILRQWFIHSLLPFVISNSAEFKLVCFFGNCKIMQKILVSA